MKNKKIILPIIIIFILIIIIGATYAVYTYTNTSSNKELLAGNIYLNYKGSTGINIQDALPGSDYSDYYEFTITGSNNYTKDIYYDVILLKGDLPDNKTESNRIKDEYLKFKLVEVVNNQETTLLTDISYDEINNKKLYVSTVPASTTNYSKTYRLYMTISDNLIIGNVEDAIYSTEEWSNIFASIKVKVTGDFTKRMADSNAILSPILEAEVSPYIVASADDFSGGLVAINTEGTLYNETSSSEEIREYRYSGVNVNNYVFLDTNGDGIKDDNEIWRIVGIFKNSSGNWNLKLIRNTTLTSDELPTSYTYNQTTFTIRDGTTNYAYLNSTLTATHYNDWTTAGLQYFLNASDGYFGNLSNNIKNKIDISYTYYLGNFYYDDNVIEGYIDERDTTNINSGNKATWTGAVALLYPSDYGYSANSSYWEEYTLYSYADSAKSTNWINQMISYREFTISPLITNEKARRGIEWEDDDCTTFIPVLGGGVTILSANETPVQVRPCINLLSTVEIDVNHLGNLNDPYTLL